MIEPTQIFSVPVYRAFLKLDEPQRLKIIKKMQNKKEEIKEVDKNAPIGNFTDFYSGKEIIYDEDLVNIKNFTLDAVQQAHNLAGFTQEISFLNSWFSITEKYGYHEAHIHPGSLWSAVYYINATPDDAALCFLNRNIIDTGWNLGVEYIPTEFNTGQRLVAPKTGLLISAS